MGQPMRRAREADMRTCVPAPCDSMKPAREAAVGRDISLGSLPAAPSAAALEVAFMLANS